MIQFLAEPEPGRTDGVRARHWQVARFTSGRSALKVTGQPVEAAYGDSGNDEVHSKLAGRGWRHAGEARHLNEREIKSKVGEINCPAEINLNIPAAVCRPLVFLFVEKIEKSEK